MSAAEIIVPIIIAILSSSALTAYINNRFAEKREKREDVEGVRDGVKLLLYDRIKSLAKSHIDRGYIYAEDLEDVHRMWECYHNPKKLDGNGYLTNLMSAVNSLPIRK